MTEEQQAIAWAKALPMTYDADQHVRLAGVRGIAATCVPAYRHHLRMEELARGRTAHFFGIPGDKISLEATIERTVPMVGEWGPRKFFFFRHDDGRLVRWLCASGKPPELEAGERVIVTGKVKEHYVKHGCVCTVLTLAKLTRAA